ncbi:hypothetical protein AAGN56_26555, partial [Klebsiella pneumoniae]
KSAQIREILISESAWEEMTCLFAPSLEVDLGNELNFIYEVRLRGYSSPTFALAAMDNNEQQTEQHRYYRAEVYLKEGGQNYDVMGWNQEQLINDILDQYEKHLHFLHLVR